MVANLSDSSFGQLSKYKIGIVDVEIRGDRPGRVFFESTYWPAALAKDNLQITVFPGQPVSVVGRSGITLLVLPINRAKVAYDDF